MITPREAMPMKTYQQIFICQVKWLSLEGGKGHKTAMLMGLVGEKMCVKYV